MTDGSREPLRITYVGHATVLIEIDGLRILTDPILRGRIMHLRALRPPPRPAELGRIDAVLVSHAHRDHLDVRSLAGLGELRLLAPRAVAASLRRRGYRGAVDPVEAGDERTIGGLEVRATPARHGRPGSAIGFVLRGSRTVYFAGDTDLFPELEGLAAPLDVALLPIWGWGPQLGEGHLDPERALEAVRLLRPRAVVPIHWGTLHPLGMSGRAFLRDPPGTFQDLVRAQSPEVDVRILAPGETAVFPLA